MAGLLRALPGRVRLAASLVLALSTVSLLTCSAQVEAAPSGHASVAAPLGGVNIGGLYEGATPAMASREIAAAKAVHAGVVRAGISWSVMEPAASGQVSAAAQAFTDRLVSAAAAD